MTDPTRWADIDAAATPLEQSLVRAGQAVRMPTEDKDLLWVRILGAIPPVPANPAPPTLGNATQPVTASAAIAPTTFKIVGVVLAMIGTGAVAHQIGWWASGNAQGGSMRSAPARESPEASGAAPREVAAATSIPNQVDTPAQGVLDADTNSEKKVEPSAAAGVNELRQTAPKTTPSPAGTSSAASAVSLLKEESQVVLAARQALRAGDATTGLRILEKAQQRFGAGILSEEREALWIEALARSGDRARASKRAKAFLSSHPRSPHTADVQRYVLP
ncbi:MAG TPA: hypothetical protein VKP30_16995 [Polyangiaceae bacterium]|nr:hypothetical protein [Polyangiaceae bacterium]